MQRRTMILALLIATAATLGAITATGLAGIGNERVAHLLKQDVLTGVLAVLAVVMCAAACAIALLAERVPKLHRIVVWPYFVLSAAMYFQGSVGLWASAVFFSALCLVILIPSPANHSFKADVPDGPRP